RGPRALGGHPERTRRLTDRRRPRGLHGALRSPRRRPQPIGDPRHRQRAVGGLDPLRHRGGAVRQVEERSGVRPEPRAGQGRRRQRGAHERRAADRRSVVRAARHDQRGRHHHRDPEAGGDGAEGPGPGRARRQPEPRHRTDARRHPRIPASRVEGAPVIVQPVLHPVLLVLLCAAPAFFVVRALIKTPRAGVPGRPIWALRLGMIVVVFAMLLRPGIPGGTSQTLATDTDIVIVVDTTASIIAEDWDGDQPRLTGVRADVQSIVDTYPVARFSLISVDAAAQLRLPLTTDATALMSSLDVMLPEITDQSRGSSISIAHRMLTDTLRAAAKAAPDRSRMVFYLGDGEQTSSGEPESFKGGAKYVDGGLVLGYGTADGGPMKKTTGRDGASTGPSTGSGTEDDGRYIEYQGERAMSVID